MLRITLLALFLFTSIATYAQDSLRQTPGKRISILTIGVGEELYASFGHTGIRIYDSATRHDEVYNYGTFDYADPDFYQKFILGKLLYALEKGPYESFIYEYKEDRRKLQEQVLNLNPAQIEKTINFLEHNLLQNNRYYKYDFIYDNCATRVRDAFPFALSEQVDFPPFLNEPLPSYRQVLNSYLLSKHWERYGINLVLGSGIDSIMTDYSSMFLPDYLHQGFNRARVDNKKLVATDTVVLATDATTDEIGFNGPFWTNIALLLVVIVCFHISRLKASKKLIAFILLLLSGLLGCFLLFMWLGTEHQSCNYNWNVLWALPLNLLAAFTIFRPRVWHRLYGILGLSLLIVALIVHIIGIQRMPMVELLPLFGCYIYVYLYLLHSAKAAELALLPQDTVAASA